VRGTYDFGGPDGRFGAGRPGHTHQGQDISAAEGTPVASPYGGTVKAVRYQAEGAGHYIVIGGSGEDRDYVFMHLVAGSTLVRPGQTVQAGQQIAQVGTTGRSSGAHLHFEIWVGGGWYTGGHPVDPLPFLQAWAGR
jgi:murein DD-endopeptidase MepM/ murein hydrolase activator NlpD